MSQCLPPAGPLASPLCLPFQPMPLFTLVARKRVEGRLVAAIHRRWREGESSRCGLCPAGSCTAYRDSCVLLTTRPVGDGKEAALFRSAGVVVYGDKPPGV